MKPKVPQYIKQKVIRQWLQGIARDQIAKDNGIGTGTVSAIIKDAKKDIPDIGLLREIALVLKSNDLDLSIFASSIRLQKRLDEMGLNEDQIESLIENINTYCFKLGLTFEEFINIIDRISTLSKKLGMSVEQLPNHITQGKFELEKVKRETEDAKVKQLQVLQHYMVTMDDLEEYRRNKPLIDRIKQLESQIENIKGERDYYAQQLKNEQIENAKLIQQWRMAS
jgi:transcriptional regulator with XRE-family HTH domain